MIPWEEIEIASSLPRPGTRPNLRIALLDVFNESSGLIQAAEQYRGQYGFMVAIRKPISGPRLGRPKAQLYEKAGLCHCAAVFSDEFGAPASGSYYPFLEAADFDYVLLETNRIITVNSKMREGVLSGPYLSHF